jgi:hypothetical protein
MFLIAKHAMLDTGFWILDEKMNKNSISNYPVSSIRHPLSVGVKVEDICSAKSSCTSRAGTGQGCLA